MRRGPLIHTREPPTPQTPGSPYALPTRPSPTRPSPSSGRPVHLGALTGEDFLNSHFDNKTTTAQPSILASTSTQPLPRKLSNTGGPPLGGFGGSSLDSQLQAAAVEIERRTDEVNAIQRNFERLSKMYMKDKDTVVKLERDNTDLRSELDAMRAERKLFAALRSEFTAMKQQQEAAKRGAEEHEAELGGALKAAQDRERHLEERLDRTHTKLVDLQRKVFTQFAPRLRDVGLTSAAIVEKLEGVVDVSGVMGGEGGEGVSTGETLRTIMRRSEMSISPPLDYHDVKSPSVHSQSNEEPPSPLPQPHTGSNLPSNIATGLNDTFAVLAPEYALGSEAEEEGRVSSSDEGRTVRASHPVIAPLDPVRLSKRSTDSLISPPRHSRRLKLLSTQLDTLFGALDMCQKDVLPCVMQFVRSSTQSHKLFKRELSALNTQIANLEADKVSLSQIQEGLEAALSSLHVELDTANRTSITAIATLQSELDTLRTQTLRNEDTTATQEVVTKGLRCELVDARREGIEKDAQIAKYQSSLATMQEETEQLRQQLSTAESNRDDSGKEVRDLQVRLAEAIRKSSSLEATVQESGRVAARRALELETALSNELALRKVAEAAASETASNLQLATTEIERANSKLNASEQQNVAYISANKLLQSQLASMEREADENEGATLSETSALRRQVAELQVALSTSDSKREGLGAQITSLRHQLDAARLGSNASDGITKSMKDAHSRDMASLREQLSATSDSVNQLRVKCAHLESEREEHINDVVRLERETDRLMSENRQQAALVASYERRQSKLETAESRVGKVRQEATRLVESLQAIEDACESGYSCQACLQVLSDPLTCAPCGHCFCRKCLEDANKRHMSTTSRTALYCPECDMPHITYAIPSRQLDLLASKFEYRKKILSGLEGLIENW